MSDKKLVIGIEVDTGQSTQQLEAVRTAAVNFGKDGATNADLLTRAFENIEATDARVTQKLLDGNIRVTGEGKKMIVQFEQMKTAVEAAFGSVAQAPAAIQQAYARAQQQFDQTTTSVRNTNLALKQHSAEIGAAGAQWHGFAQTLLEQIDPALAKVALGGIAVTAAFKEGWTIGHGWAAAMGTDFQSQNEVMDSLAKTAGRVVSSLSDVAVNVFSGNIKEATKSLIAADGAFSMTETQLKGYKIALDQAGDGVYLVKDRVLEFDKVLQLHNDIQELGKKGLEAQNELQDAGKISTEAYLAAVNKLLPSIDALAKSHKAAGEEDDKRQKYAADGIKQIEKVIEALNLEIAARASGVEAMKQEQAILKPLDDAYKKAEEHAQAANDARQKGLGVIGGEIDELKRLIPTIDQNTNQVQDFTAALKKSADEGRDGLNPVLAAQIDAFVQLATSYQKGDSASKDKMITTLAEIERGEHLNDTVGKTKIVYDATTGTYTNVTEVAVKLTKAHDGLGSSIANTTEKAGTGNVKLDESKTAISNVAEAATKGTASFASFGAKLGDQTANLEHYRGKLDEIDQKFILIATHAKDAADALNKFDEAAAKAGSGSSGGNPYVNTSEAP
jgi:hypothetical protein